jgi:hypothetical protein
MTINRSLKDFAAILEQITPNNRELVYNLNPFFLSFIETELKSKGVEISGDEIKTRIHDHLFDTFNTLSREDKLLILFSYVIFSSIIDSLDHIDKEGLVKIVDNGDLKNYEKDYQVLLDLNIIDLDQSVIIRIINYSIDEAYKETRIANIRIKEWAIKSFILSFIGIAAILTALYFIPVTHNYIYGNTVDLVFTRFGEILKLIFLSK